MRFILLFLLIPQISPALEIPKRLDTQDRREVTRMLGLNTSTKMLSNPYPLGGYSGLELGVSMEAINVNDLSRLGCQSSEAGCPNQKVSDEKEFRYARISIGKGLYQNVDFYLNFVPPVHTELSDFGGAFRWSFFQAKFLPINLSLLLHANRMNLKDTVYTQNTGGELLAGINVNDFAIYFGGGYMKSEATFIGGDTGTGTVATADPHLNSDVNKITETVFSSHTFVGVTMHFEEIFIAAQIDRYKDPVMSVKLGLRL